MTAAQMAALHAAAFRFDRAWSADEFAALLDQPGCFAVGDTRSFALVRVVLDDAELLTIATDPTCQRQGCARAVMAGWMQTAAARGATRAFLEVASDNAPAMSLYESLGFTVCGTRPGYYRRDRGPAADAVVMSRGLP